MGSLLSVESATLALLVVGLPLYNYFANRWPPFNGALYVPLNVGLLALVLALGLGSFGLSLDEITGEAGPGGALTGTLLGFVVALPLFALIATSRGRRVVADERVAHLSDLALAYQTLVRIPIGTALVEETVFRGVLFAAWPLGGTLDAAVASSVVFGLWHVGPTINLVQANNPTAPRASRARTMVGAVGFTTLVGLFFCWLRLRIGLWGPVSMHAVVNGLATVASVMAHRRERALTRRG